MRHLKGQTIWLIGASTGIGEALAYRLADAGASLIVSARNKEALGRIVPKLAGSTHLAQALDVTDLQSVERAWNVVNSRYPHLDMVIYNAGSYEPMSARQFDLPKVEQMVDVNFHGSLRILHKVLPHFLAQKSGHIVLVASMAAYIGLPNAIGYGASKAALLHLGENLRLDLHPRGINVQIVNPGFVKTRLTDKNNFHMPFLMSAESAADAMIKGLTSNVFEIRFPKRLSFLLRMLRLLPYSLYFRLVQTK